MATHPHTNHIRTHPHPHTHTHTHTHTHAHTHTHTHTHAHTTTTPNIMLRTPQVFCGSVGSSKRQEYAMVGDIVNLR